MSAVNGKVIDLVSILDQLKKGHISAVELYKSAAVEAQSSLPLTGRPLRSHNRMGSRRLSWALMTLGKVSLGWTDALRT